jgi:hypothetical protein
MLLTEMLNAGMIAHQKKTNSNNRRKALLSCYFYLLHLIKATFLITRRCKMPVEYSMPVFHTGSRVSYGCFICRKITVFTSS